MSVIGTIAWLLAGQRITVWSRKVWIGMGLYGQAALWLPGYFAFLVFIHLMPFDLTISPVEVYHKWKEGRIILVPFTTHYDSSHKAFLKNFANCLYFLPVGLLLANLRHRFWQEGRNAWKIWSIGLLTAGSVEFLQLFVFTRYADTTDILTGSFSVLFGWYLGVCGQRLSARASMRLCLVGVVACMALVFYSNWEPFRIDTDPTFLAKHWHDVNWIPFADYYWGTEYDAFDNLLRKTLPFFIGGVCWAGAMRQATPQFRLWSMVGGSLFVTLLVKSVQILMPDHFPGITDVLMQPLAGALGTIVGGRLPWAVPQTRETMEPHE